MSSIDLDEGGIIVACRACGQKNRLAYSRLGEEVRCGKCKEPVTAPSEPIELRRAADFDAVVARAAVPVVVDYWAPWCGPCRMVAPELEKVATRQAGRMVVVKVNTDDLPELGERFSIRSIPTLAVFAGGRELSRMLGARPAADIERFIEQATTAVHRG